MVDSIAWKPNSLEFTTGCYDGSVRVWKLVETLDGWSVQQICGTGNSVLAASGASLSKAIGLSPVNRQLLEQSNFYFSKTLCDAR
ncbi:hypothetical protein FBU30_006008 [Linnemannia zychae]|nr:hypothetical protein FBU30_006008 [Linnemannia zychae]